jgi:hypothetical protein
MNMSPIYVTFRKHIMVYWNILKLCHLVRSSCLQSHREAGYVLRPGDVLKLLLFASAGGTSSMLSRCLLWTICSGTRLYKHTNSIYTYWLIFMHIDTVYIYIGQGWIRLNIAQINPLLGHSQEAKAAGKGRTSPVGMKKKSSTGLNHSRTTGHQKLWQNKANHKLVGVLQLFGATSARPRIRTRCWCQHSPTKRNMSNY